MKHDLAKIVKEAMKNVLKEMDAVAFKEKSGASLDPVPRKVGQSTGSTYVMKEMDAVAFKEKNGMSMDSVPRKVGQSTGDRYVKK